MVDLHAGIPFEGGRRDVVVLADAKDGFSLVNMGSAAGS